MVSKHYNEFRRTPSTIEGLSAAYGRVFREIGCLFSLSSNSVVDSATDGDGGWSAWL
jgi:hypothetical protein